MAHVQARGRGYLCSAWTDDRDHGVVALEEVVEEANHQSGQGARDELLQE